MTHTHIPLISSFTHRYCSSPAKTDYLLSFLQRGQSVLACSHWLLSWPLHSNTETDIACLWWKPSYQCELRRGYPGFLYSFTGFHIPLLPSLPTLFTNPSSSQHRHTQTNIPCPWWKPSYQCELRWGCSGFSYCSAGSHIPLLPNLPTVFTHPNTHTHTHTHTHTNLVQGET